MSIVLDSTTKKLELVLGEAVAENALQWIASYADKSTTTFTPGLSTGYSSTGTASITLVEAPSADQQRLVNNLNIYNADTAGSSVKIVLDNDGTDYILINADLDSYDTLQFANDEWRVVNSDGSLKQTIELDYVEVTGDTMTGALKIDTNSATALVVEQDGVHDNTLVVDTADGNVGIGVTDPDTTLEIYKVGTQLKLSGGAADYATFAVAADGALTITTVDADAAEGDIALMPDGNVGIGTTVPKGKLDVVGVASLTHYGVINSAPSHTTAYSATSLSGVGEAGLYIQNINASGVMASIKLSVREAAQAIWEIANVRTADYIGDLTFVCRSAAANYNERMRITSTGNVGIGTTSPSGRVHINGTADDQQLIVEAHSTQTNNILEIQNSSAQTNFMIDDQYTIAFRETTTPTADADFGKIYTKSDNKLYFQDGAGVEHEIAYAV